MPVLYGWPLGLLLARRSLHVTRSRLTLAITQALLAVVSAELILHEFDVFGDWQLARRS